MTFRDEFFGFTNVFQKTDQFEFNHGLLRPLRVASQCPISFFYFIFGFILEIRNFIIQPSLFLLKGHPPLRGIFERSGRGAKSHFLPNESLTRLLRGRLLRRSATPFSPNFFHFFL